MSTTQVNITQRTADGFYQTNTGTKATGWPEDTSNWQHLISSTHDNVDNYFSLQMAGSFFDNDNFYVRKTAGSGNRPWHRLWHDGDFKRGRGMGDVVHYENFGGAPTLLTDDGFVFRQATANGRSYANIRVLRSLDPGCDPGRVPTEALNDHPDVNFNMLVQTDINESMAAAQWNAISRVNIGAGVYRKYPHGDEPVVHGFILDKKGDIPAWNLYSVTKDYTANPIYATLGHERGFQANGPDPHHRRVVEDVQLNSIDDVAGYQKYGNNEIWAYINCGPSLGEPERIILQRFALVKGRVGRVLDMTETTDYSRENVVFPNDGFMSWRGGQDAPMSARLGWNQSISTFFMDGMKLLPTSNPNVLKGEIVINGQAFHVDLTKA